MVGGGFPLFAIPASGDKPVPLGRTLAGGQVNTIVASANGDLAISDNPGDSGARPFWQNEQVLTCHPTTLSCGPVRSAAGTISFDPVWSPDGSQLAYLVGKEVGGESEPGFLQSPVSSWYNSLQLWLYSTRTGRSTQSPAAKGAVVPIWSADSKSLLYIDNDGLWLLKTPKSQPSEVAGPLLPPNDWNPYYAQVHWAGLFAWSRSQNVPQPGVLTPMRRVAQRPHCAPPANSQIRTTEYGPHQYMLYSSDAASSGRCPVSQAHGTRLNRGPDRVRAAVGLGRRASWAPVAHHERRP